MSPKIVTSSLTSRGTTTIPQEIRYMLGLETGDTIMYVPHEKGALISRVQKDEQVCPHCSGTGRCKIKKESDSR